MTTYYFRFYRQILNKDGGRLNRTRLRILFVCIITFIILSSILSLIYLTGAPNLLLYRILFFLALFVLDLYLFLSKKPWRLSAHCFLLTVTLLIWTNVLLVRQSLYVINIQYCMLVIAAGYYILGSRDGARYSIAAIFPVLADILFNDFLKIEIPSRLVNVNYIGYGFTVLINFLLILYIHHQFFRSHRKFKKREALSIQNLERALLQSREQAMAKTNFLNTMSHEIRTPLNAIVGMSNLLMSGKMLAEQKEDLTVLNFSAQNLMATVNNIIDFNNLDNAGVILQAKPFAVLKTMHSICGTFKEEALQKGLKFDTVIDEQLNNVVVNGDELRFSQIMFHLIGNAVKFTKKGFVSVYVQTSEKHQQAVSIDFKIVDSGIGISKVKQQQVLDPFKRKMSRTQRQYQTTLGLTIAGQLLKLHGSELKIASSDRGSTFQFAIRYPLVGSGELTEPEPPLMADNELLLEGLRVLCVDDEKLNLMVVRKTLSKWNITTEEAENGQIAVEMCRIKSYDVILMDINMPVMDGFEASKLIKAFDHKPVIIALTASVGIAKDEVLRSKYIDDCVLKPFKPEDLKQKLQKVKIGFSNE